MQINFVHVNLIAKDWRKLADFYIQVFGCVPVPPERHLSGKWVEELTGLEQVKIDGIHLALPGFESEPRVTLEIFQYNQLSNDTEKSIHQPGFAHIAFQVENVTEILDQLKTHGGSSLGKLVEQQMNGLGLLTVVYARDPEGNIIELQNWSK